MAELELLSRPLCAVAMTTFDMPFLVGVKATSPTITRDESRSTRFATPFRGVRTSTDWPTDLRGRTQALAPTMTEDSFFCGPSAAALLELPLPYWLADAPVTVAVPEDCVHHRRRGVVHRRLQVLPEEVTMRQGMRLTSPIRTFLDLAADLPFHHLVAVGDEVVRSHGVSTDQMLVVLNHRIRYPGKPLARRTIPHLSSLAESPQESRTRALLLDAGLPKPVPQFVVRDSRGRFIARVDLAYPELKIAIEYDGDIHRDIARFRADARRRTALRAAGWYVVEVVAPDVRRPYDVVGMVRTAIRAQGGP